MIELAITVGLVIVVTALCSLAEAAFYSVPWSRIEQLRKQGHAAGDDLFKLRTDVEKPITAILTVATITHTAGSALAGAAAVEYFGPDNLGAFAVVFTASMLILSEVLPKSLGVIHARTLAPYMAKPLRACVWAFMPVIWACGNIVRMAGGKKRGPEATEEDIRAVVSLTRQAGLIKPDEELTIKNILSLDGKTVHEVMTPRTVVFSLPADLPVSQAWKKGAVWPHSRVPVYDSDDPEDVVGVVFRRAVLEALAQDRHEVPLSMLMKPAGFVLETLTLDRLLRKFLESRTHLFVVLDEYGGVAGVVTLEDVLEEILGSEIVDETDQVVDMRELARQRRKNLQIERRNARAAAPMGQAVKPEGGAPTPVDGE